MSNNRKKTEVIDNPSDVVEVKLEVFDEQPPTSSTQPQKTTNNTESTPTTTNNDRITRKLLKTRSETHRTNVTYKCDACSLVFEDGARLRKHFKMHMQCTEKLYRCETCKKCFSLSGKERHEKVHTMSKRYRCVMCGACFNQSSVLRSHLMRVHMGKKNAGKV